MHLLVEKLNIDVKMHGEHNVNTTWTQREHNVKLIENNWLYSDCNNMQDIAQYLSLY